MSALLAGPVYEALIARPERGFVVLGEDERRAVAVCTVSWVDALRSGGPYAIIQARARHRARARARRTVRRAGHALDGRRQIAFYARSGFVSVGERLRLASR